ncbi:MAG: hypothetical protein MRY72_12905, partial [Aquisalinus sp.]|nr:hypothetical protein [Aquisalinus sp.]
MLKLDSSMPSIDILVALLQGLIRFKWLVLFLLVTTLTTLLWQQRADHAIDTDPNAGTFAGGKDTYSDSLVLGRINRAHQEGTFSQYGLLGWYSDRRSGITAIAKANESIEYYLENKSANLPVRSKPLREPYPYRGNVGIQGWFSYAIDSGLRFFSVPPKSRLYILENTNRVLLASLFSAILIMLAQRGFFFPSAAAWLMLIGSNWLAIYSASLYWSLWLWALPVFAAYYIKIYIPTSIALQRRTWGQSYLTKPFVSEIIIAGLVFISFLKGFEVTTPMLVCIGLCYIAIPLTQFKIWDTLKAGTISVVACFIGILMAIIATVTLTASFLGSLNEGIDTFTSRITKSTSFVSDNNVQSLYEVPNLQAVDIHLWLNEQAHLFWLEIGAGEMLSFSIASLLMMLSLILIIQRVNKKPLQWSDKIIPVIIFVLIGFFATASWLFIAAQHSLLHRGILRGIWILPFLPLAAGLLSWAFQYTFKIVHANAVVHNIRGKSLLAFSALPIFVILISASAIASLTQ